MIKTILLIAFLQAMKKTNIILYIIIILIILPIVITLGCIYYPETIIEIVDIRSLSQDATFYLGDGGGDEALLSADYHMSLNADFDRCYFQPWHKEKPHFSCDEASWGFKKFWHNPGYGENKRGHTKKWIEALWWLADFEHYPNGLRKGVTIKNSSLRVLPTYAPLFSDFKRAGEGYPFDMLQNSAVWANTPVFISHFSSDGSWCFVESPFAIGWLPISDIAFVDDAFIREWESYPFIALINDNIPFYDNASVYRFTTHIGAIFPMVKELPERFKCLIAVSDETRDAMIVQCMISKGVATLKPLKASTLKIAQIANKIINQPYGWGGMYENRDCSSTIRDIFTPFGIWLPRNSYDQSRSRMFISLKNLKPAEKEKLIIENAVPFFTLIWMKGHIMLYIGSVNNRAIIFHNLWGIRTKHLFYGEGRNIIGHAAITTLQPGIELPHIDLRKGDLLRRIEGMAILCPPKAMQRRYRE